MSVLCLPPSHSLIDAWLLPRLGAVAPLVIAVSSAHWHVSLMFCACGYSAHQRVTCCSLRRGASDDSQAWAWRPAVCGVSVTSQPPPPAEAGVALVDSDASLTRHGFRKIGGSGSGRLVASPGPLGTGPRTSILFDISGVTGALLKNAEGHPRNRCLHA